MALRVEVFLFSPTGKNGTDDLDEGRRGKTKKKTAFNSLQHHQQDGK